MPAGEKSARKNLQAVNNHQKRGIEFSGSGSEDKIPHP